MPMKFTPHIVLVCERNAPQVGQIVACAMAGGPKALLVVDLNLKLPAETFTRQAVMKLPRGVPVFGRVHGFWLCYTPTFSVRLIERDGQSKPDTRGIELGRSWMETIH